VASLLAGGDRLPTDQLPGAAKKRKVKHKKGSRPAFVRRVAGNHRKLAVHDLIRPVQTATEVALFVHLLPDFRRGSSADYWGMAIEFNNRLLQAFTAGKPLDAYPKSSRELRQYGDAYVKQTRQRDSLMLLGFTQALTPLSPSAPLIFNPHAMAAGQPAPPVAAPQQLQTAAVSSQPTAHTAVVIQPAVEAAAQPLASVFQRPVSAASGQKRFRDRSAGKSSNQGTERGGKNVQKSCAACFLVIGKAVPMAGKHILSCPYCGVCVKKSKGQNAQLKKDHVCPHAK